MSGPDYFYSEAGSAISSTELTRGPWDPKSQHAGPPAALLARAIERCPGLGNGPEDRQVGRITLEILRPVPIGPLTVVAEVARPGRRVEMVEAELRTTDGQQLIRARAWRLRRGAVALPAGVSSEAPEGAPAQAGRPSGATGPPTPPDQLEASPDFFPTGHDVGYHTGMEYRSVLGGFNQLGPAFCWLRARQPLIDGEEMTPLQRVMIAADTGNGISVTLDFTRFLFINVDLSVHLHRMPVGEWIGLDSLTVPEPTGVGISDTLLYDEHGPIGRACQTLLIAER